MNDELKVFIEPAAVPWWCDSGDAPLKIGTAIRLFSGGKYTNSKALKETERDSYVILRLITSCSYNTVYEAIYPNYPFTVISNSLQPAKFKAHPH